MKDYADNLRKLAAEKGVDLNLQDAQGDVARQLDQLNTLITQGYKYFVIIPQDTSATEQMAQQIKAAGGLFGLFNGYLIAYGKLPPFIATLGSMSIAKGLQLIYTKAAVVGSLNQNFKNISQGSVGPIPNLIIYVIIAAFIVWVVLKHTRQGTHFNAIGGNAQAARVSGINVERDLMMVYTYAGILYGIAGTLLASRLGLANSLTANGMELDAIAAVTVGGVSQSGGVGSVSGMMVGVFTMGLINYGMSFLGVDSYYQQLVKGFIIIVAVYFDMKKYARRS